MNRKIFFGLLVYVSILSMIYVPNVFAVETNNSSEVEEEFVIKYDENGNERVLDDSGTQVAFYRETAEQYFSDNLSPQEIFIKNEKFANHLIELEGYVLDGFSYNEELEFYTSTYYKYCDGYKTQDYCFIDTDLSGNVLSFAALNQGTFDNIDLNRIKKRKLEDYINNIYKLYPDVMDYKTENIIATLNENKQVELCVSTELTYIDGTRSIEDNYINLNNLI